MIRLEKTDKKTVMENLARAAYEKGVFNGAWLYAENGEIVSKGAFGFRDAEDKLPMTENSIFEMASVTKMFTAAAIMLLVREGRLGLDDEYAKLCPDYPYEGVTIRHLLTHTGGMPDFDVEDLVGPVLDKENRIPENSEIVRMIRDADEEVECAPGEAFHYPDVNYMLLANAVEKVSGMRFEDFMKKNVFEPAGMKDSGIYHTRRDGRPSDRFTRNMVLEGDDNFVPSDVSELCRRYVVGSDGMNGCDYLYTTIFDMLAWDRALREEKVLTREEQRILYTPVRLNSGEEYRDEDGKGYGFGWCIGSEPAPGAVVSHSGGMPGLETWFERFVDADRVLVLMSCRDYTDVRAFISFWERDFPELCPVDPGRGIIQSLSCHSISPFVCPYFASAGISARTNEIVAFFYGGEVVIIFEISGKCFTVFSLSRKTRGSGKRIHMPQDKNSLTKRAPRAKEIFLVTISCVCYHLFHRFVTARNRHDHAQKIYPWRHGGFTASHIPGYVVIRHFGND